MQYIFRVLLNFPPKALTLLDHLIYRKDKIIIGIIFLDFRRFCSHEHACVHVSFVVDPNGNFLFSFPPNDRLELGELEHAVSLCDKGKSILGID